MTENAAENETKETPGDPLAADEVVLDQAFARLSGRISMLSRAVDRFADRQDELVGRDYSDDLAKIEKSFEETSEALDNLAAQPVLQLTPDRLAEQLRLAGARMRSDDHDKWQSAQNQLGEITRSLEKRLGAARLRDEQNRWVAIGSGIAAVLAFVAGCTMPPVIDRTVPESWQWPERRAANLLSRDMWGGGVRLMQAADLERWNALAQASQIYGRNQKAIETCRKQADRKKKPVNCSIEIESTEAPS
ncbi:hypothetical protein GGC65_003436 [Sphingopyxis sp. OAS728]|uniref:DUF6118 family protein n=1 Tax=Sphingopyxis sp. OAS728 TaxID=2663823 RepID=UPI00178B2DD1|nr:DUF6118 family protein [Sphingopyxis sp. OAS728]MBE1528980.1 hypothetical protein [Sphingopyxis sp. OAS728]